MILRGYFDESYDKHVFTLCCSLSNPKGWGAIERSWKLCLNAKNKSLKRQGRLTISRYHSSHANARDHEFKGWSKEERDAFAVELMSTLTRGDAWINSVSYSLPLQEFKQKFEIEGDPLPYAYRECLKFIMLEMGIQVEDANRLHGPIKPISFVLFYERCDYNADYLHAFDKMMADSTFRFKHMFSKIAALGWEQCIALQAADMIAYESFKDALRKYNQKNRRRSLEYLLQSKRFGGRAKQLLTDNLEEWRQILDASVRAKT
jgi:hypothetical protein